MTYYSLFINTLIPTWADVGTFPSHILYIYIEDWQFSTPLNVFPYRKYCFHILILSGAQSVWIIFYLGEEEVNTQVLLYSLSGWCQVHQLDQECASPLTIQNKSFSVTVAWKSSCQRLALFCKQNMASFLTGLMASNLCGCRTFRIGWPLCGWVRMP